MSRPRLRVRATALQIDLSEFSHSCFVLSGVNGFHSAEGECQSQISIATGEQQVSILRAKGLSDGRILVAKAEAEAIQIIGDALKVTLSSLCAFGDFIADCSSFLLQEFGVNVTQYMIGLRYIETFTSIATAAKKRDIYFPMEVSLVSTYSFGQPCLFSLTTDTPPIRPMLWVLFLNFFV